MSFRRVRDPDRLHALIEAMMLIESDLDLSVLLRSIVAVACELIGSRYGALGVLNADETELSNFITYGLSVEEERRIGDLPRGHGLLGQVITTVAPRRSDDLTADPDFRGFPTNHPVMKTFIGVPVMKGDGHVFGNLYLTDRVDTMPFTDDDEALLEAFGLAAGLIVDEARLRSQLRELTLSEERERLARNLHDTVIQRLFAVGLSLQSLATADIAPAVRERLNSAVDDLDATIREIRTTIFDVSRERYTANTLRSRALNIITEVTTRLQMPVDITFEGPIDTMVGPACGDHAIRVLRELLTNVVRHASASHVKVTFDVSSDGLRIAVFDDGAGISSNPIAGRGLRNMAERAAEMGGSFELSAGESAGTTAVWTARRLD